MSVQSGFAVWLTGLPASGKTTLARALCQRLTAQGMIVQLLDSDELRQKLTPHPTYSATERDWFYEMIVFLAELLTQNGVNVIIAATAPRRAYRQAARARLPHFAEIYVACPAAVCRTRDPKGLWEQADRGHITALPGAGVCYEPPLWPELSVNTAEQPVQTSVTSVYHYLVRAKLLKPEENIGTELLPT